MFIQFKKFLFKQRIFIYYNVEHSRLIKQIESYPFQQIHLTEQWTRHSESKTIPTSPNHTSTTFKKQLAL
jgi:hypothetical protein